MQVTIRAREQNCTGKIVDEKVLLVHSPGNGSQATLEVTLIAPDEDGDGYVAILGGEKGGSDCDDRDSGRSPAQVELCDDKDNNCNGVSDEGFDKKWYLDEDGDGVPRGPDFVSSCTSPGAKYKHHVEGQLFDCTDTGPDAEKIFPGNPEVCDNIDNDCDDVVDNGFAPRGVACNAECQGVTVCSNDGTAVVCSQAAGRYYYPDRDGDGQGDWGTQSTIKCGLEPPDPGTVPNDDDCDDLDPAARTGLAEVCDAIDNNCDGVVDNAAQVCGGTLKNVTDHHVTSSSQDWKTVSVGTGGHVWVAGRGGKLALHRPGAQKFEGFSFGDTTVPPTDGSAALNPNNCGDRNWTASWVNAGGVVFLGGEGGWLAIHTGASSFSCDPGQLPTSTDNITGMVGFEEGGVTTLYLSDTSGRLTRWRPGAPVAERFTSLNNSDSSYYGLHALAPDFVLAVGAEPAGSNVQRFLSYNVDAQSNVSTPIEHTANPNNVGGTVRSVWMGSDTSACAVGDNAAVWRWDGGTAWNKVDGPAGVAGRFSGVVMRNDTQSLLTGQCYVVGGDGTSRSRVHRLTPYGWAKPLDIQSATANVALNDLAITPTGEIWIVGEDGRVFHYPEP
ncbi:MULTISPECIES: putative metal-binding motif-containing protein [unclassified Myxococcus]|uniref:putative metal-binding motif-containing protein n=1 Tax=unclassified Myxococcus TaxID=2648731 RepID=UPI001CBF03C9|nr:MULTISPECIES: putative metal-binding motif-containing protein [unclassified Myxococcus]MBZ4399291.1 putative metal-binding motif-containing protein [Myxococcus sp. AS-1-15]MBZ4411502.1 putative metal-binding motif-containing protein [Myxococcus sp. XM-1-1-1]